MPYYYSPLRKTYETDRTKSRPRTNEYSSVFCDPDIIQKQGIRDEEGKLIENEHYFWMINWFPKTEGHTMLIPKRYITNHAQESPEEILARHELLVFTIEILKRAFQTDGAEVYNQHGSRSFASVDHLHWHVVPVAKDDPLWEGSLAHMEKMGYYFTDQEGVQKVEMFPKTIQYARETLQQLLTDTIKQWKKL